MIFVKREREPAILKKNKVNWLSEYEISIATYKANPNKKNRERVVQRENKYKQAEVKKALKKMFEDKCAYCESYISHVSFGHIEHFRPKSRYPKLCFSWNNFLLGCEVCNGQYKGVQFPLKKDNGPIVNPTIEDPFSYLSFEYDPATGTANVLGKNARGITTEDILSLNRPELIRHRSRIVRRMAIMAINASKGDIDALTEMRKLIKPEEEYSAFAIVLFNKYGLK